MRCLGTELQQLSTQQAGLLSSSQLAADGFRRRDVDLRVARGDWRRVSDRVIAVHAQDLDRRSQLWAASLHFDCCGLAGPSVLEVLGMPEPHDHRIHVIGPRAGRLPPMANCVVHTSTAHTFATRSPDCVATDMAVLQSLRWAISVRQAVFHATWAIQRGFVTLEALQLASRETRRSPGSARMRQRLALIDPGVHSVSEFDFARECRSRHLPEPVRQRERTDSRGRSRYTDAEFVVNGRTLVVEIDGLGHLETAVYVDDQWRANELMLQGAPVLRIPALALRTDPEPFFQQLRRALSTLRAA
jgi:hypothetical protein